ncbi:MULTISPECIES: hypothetical protein [Enterobacteriaceae]|nr:MULTISPECIES: hypothetical protein [Enterobacteriaceae]EFO2220155.1 hypothetical protein [Escherichia coli O11]ATX14396.1 hypothetical protein CU077_10120 [Escherichia coli]AWT01038.1 hypothetical protein BEN53_08080 [Escherichia coli]AZR89568.1 hypothetical protein DWB25_14825 [Escherichia coli]EAB9245084.1 hypothetical protein [Escherichia coli]
MPALSEYSNVHNTVFNILICKGYRLWHEKKQERYYAEKDGWDFVANSPCALLGLIAIYEYKKPDHYYEYWWKDEGLHLEKNISEIAPEYNSIILKNN